MREAHTVLIGMIKNNDIDIGVNMNSPNKQSNSYNGNRNSHQNSMINDESKYKS